MPELGGMHSCQIEGSGRHSVVSWQTPRSGVGPAVVWPERARGHAPVHVFGLSYVGTPG